MADRLLVVSYAFPPIAVPEAVLAAKALHALEGFEIDLVCAAPMSWHGRDESFLGYAEEHLSRVVRVEVPWWLPVAQPLRSMRRYPDAMRFLRRRVLRAARMLQPERYSALLTWSQWHSVHLVGLDIVGMEPLLPWMAHFSDPWVDNPLVPLDPVARRVAVRMERAVVRSADALVFTAEPARRMTMGRYPVEWAVRSHVVPHLFEEELYGSAGTAADPSPTLIIRHLGTFYGDRRPDPLVSALERLAARMPEALEGVRVELIGSMTAEMRRSVEDAAVPRGLIEVVGRVDYRRSLALMRESSVLVAIDAPGAESVFLASKVVDYLGSGRPIVALVPPGAAADLVRAVGGWVADSDDVNGAADALVRALESARSSAGEPWGEQGVRDQFAAARVGAKRSGILHQIIDESGRRMRH